MIYAKGNWTFCTKDFSDKSFSTSFGLFAQFLVVILQDTSMRSCIPAEKILAIGLYILAHGNSYVSIAPVFNVRKSKSLKQYKMS